MFTRVIILLSDFITIAVLLNNQGTRAAWASMIVLPSGRSYKNSVAGMAIMTRPVSVGWLHVALIVANAATATLLRVINRKTTKFLTFAIVCLKASSGGCATVTLRYGKILKK